MKNTVRLMLFLIVVCALALATPVLAGGWAVITLDELPGEVESGQPIEVGFTVLQHGKEPMEGLTPQIRLTNTTTGEAFSASASPDGEAGHYSATLNFPSEGKWNWSIEAFTMNNSMPPIEVLSKNPENRAILPPLNPWLIAAAGMGIIAGGMIFIRRRSVLWASALVVIGIVLGGYGLVSATGASAFPDSGAQVSGQNLTAAGRDLFVAKGCITCHAHAEIDRNDNKTIYVDFGPDLTNFTADPEYIRLWLSDPSSIKPNTQMPKLHLSEEEIERLIAFVNSE